MPIGVLHTTINERKPMIRASVRTLCDYRAISAAAAAAAGQPVVLKGSG